MALPFYLEPQVCGTASAMCQNVVWPPQPQGHLCATVDDHCPGHITYAVLRNNVADVVVRVFPDLCSSALPANYTKVSAGQTTCAASSCAFGYCPSRGWTQSSYCAAVGAGLRPAETNLTEAFCVWRLNGSCSQVDSPARAPETLAVFVFPTTCIPPSFTRLESASCSDATTPNQSRFGSVGLIVAAIFAGLGVAAAVTFERLRHRRKQLENQSRRAEADDTGEMGLLGGNARASREDADPFDQYALNVKRHEEES
eukprot:TRINITY_DN19336_c0_g1_i1.p1 TRINITY_DN19336_c0_g1~~TRINITY_DN19336_c0_g1_i1.p1  ORF type:complete len:278 (-),score=39.97 TRINITY_DN19336_c0_g1_i1:2-769(-)